MTATRSLALVLAILLTGCGDGGYKMVVAGDYSLVRCSDREVLLIHGVSKRALRVGNVVSFAVKGSYITGFGAGVKGNPPRADEPEGYFLLNAAGGSVSVGLSAAEWSTELLKIDWPYPELRRPK